MMKRCTILGIAFLFSLVVAMFSGSQRIPPDRVLDVLLGRSADAVTRQIILDIRFPRVLLAGLAGAALAMAGASFQSLLRNPLADPYILGVSSGAAIGAVTSLSVFKAPSTITMGLCAFVAACVTIFIVHMLSTRRSGETDADRMLLVGMAFSSFSASMLILFLGRSSGNDARAILHWLIGDVSGKRLSEIAMLLPQIIVLMGILMLLSHRFNLLALDGDVAASLGLDVARQRRVGYLLASFLTASIVCLSGSIGFVGLVVPHLARLLFSSDCRRLFPISAVLGATLLMLADAIGRVAFAPFETPVGVITALLGAPVFIYILYSQRKRTLAERIDG